MWKYIDWVLVIIMLLLVGYGIISIINATANPFTGDESGFSEFMENLDLSYANRQLMFFAIGVGSIFLILLVDYHAVRNLTMFLYLAGVVFLVIVLQLGTEVNGTTGWFRVGGYGIQPSEFCKITTILALARVISDKTEGHEDGITKIRDIWPALWRFAIPFGLIVAQPDIGTAVVYAFIFFIMLFMAKTSWKILLLLIVLCIVAVLVMYPFLEPYQQNRIQSWWNPEAQDEDSLLQVNQAKMAIGSGGLTGKGLFAPGSLSQLDYVPEKHNDFIFAVTVEALGFLGGAVLIVLYFFLIGRTFMLAMRAKDDFGAYILVGVAAMTLFHTFENISMNVGLLPVTGIPLPFFSYGGSNLLTNMIAFGIVLSVDMRRTRWPIG